MKCDELQAEQWLDYSGEPMPCYPKAKVDDTFELTLPALKAERLALVSIAKSLKKKEFNK